MKNGITINGKEYELVDVPYGTYCCGDCDLSDKCDIISTYQGENLCEIFPNSTLKHFKLKRK